MKHFSTHTQAITNMHNSYTRRPTLKNENLFQFNSQFLYWARFEDANQFDDREYKMDC